jgi:quinol monooxygenase YgiN
MSVLIVNMTARPEKRRELLQTLYELTDTMRQEQGFLEARIDIDAENHNRVTFTETWETRQDVDVYVQQSRYFQVLRGAMKVLTSSAEIEFSTNGGPEHVRNHDQSPVG